MEWVTSNGTYSGWFRNCRKLKTPVDEDIDLLEKASKENNDVEFGEEKDFDDETIAVIIAASSISSVTPIQGS